MLRGREVPATATLRSVGVASGDSIVTVRRELIAEGKHLVQLQSFACLTPGSATMIGLLSGMMGHGRLFQPAGLRLRELLGSCSR